MIIKGQIIDVFARRIYSGEIEIENGIIKDVRETDTAPDYYIMSGFVDSHVHIESSMLTPARFAELAVCHGTLATVSDPHEITNVLGVEGLDFMIENAKQVPLNFFFGLPSCVPATTFETSGACINAAEVEKLILRDDLWYLGEMMNYPGVVFDDAEVHAKIKATLNAGKPVDGHAPLLSGDQLQKYAAAGISTDHECTNIKEAEEKINLGMKILIREGSAARDFDALWPLIDKYPNEIMLCTDDCHPDELQKRHINLLAERALKNGCDLFNVLKVSCINPVLHYKLPIGMLRKGDPADFLLVKNIENFELIESYINGVSVYNNSSPTFKVKSGLKINRFDRKELQLSDIALKAEKKKAKIIIAKDGGLLTESIVEDLKIENGFAVSDSEKDILKIIVASRYDNSAPSIGFIKGFGLKEGALACSIAHDSHNLIAVGVNDQDILTALNTLIKNKGGLTSVKNDEKLELTLPIAGLMSDAPGYEIAAKYKQLNQFAVNCGSSLNAPFMTMAFMALLVIPELKLSDMGLFDGLEFKFTPLFVD